jgi:hypothetical protein
MLEYSPKGVSQLVTEDAVGETPTAAVETTALPNNSPMIEGGKGPSLSLWTALPLRVCGRREKG